MTEHYEWPWPTGAAANYVLGLQRELEAQISERVAVFLDTNFWIKAREAAFTELADKEARLILEALLFAVDSGRAFFPITADLIEEFSKQTPGVFIETMKLVDHLSLGVALVPDYERMVIEIEAFFGRTFPQHPPYVRPIWTRAAFAFGYEDLCPAGVELHDSLLVALADKAWRAMPSKVAASYAPDLFNAKSESEQLAEFLRKQEIIHAHEITSHSTALRLEIAGATSMITGIAAREFRRLALANGMSLDAEGINASNLFGQKMALMIAAALTKEEHQRNFGSLYVPAALHAGLRSHKGREIKPNDLFDFRHAAAALPYCRAFFTERSLKSLITSGHMQLDRLYGCTVLNSVEEAISWIRKI